MQYLLDATFLFSIFAGLVSVTGGIYLHILWRKQRVCLLTDLPLLFGATFTSRVRKKMKGLFSFVQVLSLIVLCIKATFDLIMINLK